MAEVIVCVTAISVNGEVKSLLGYMSGACGFVAARRFVKQLVSALTSIDFRDNPCVSWTRRVSVAVFALFSKPTNGE